MVVLSLTAWQAFRIQAALAWYDTLMEFAPRPGPIYIAVTGAVWLVLGLILIWSIWRGQPGAAKLLLGAASGYTVWYWADRLLLQSPRANWPFAIIVNILLLAYISALTIPRIYPIDTFKRGV